MMTASASSHSMNTPDSRSLNMPSRDDLFAYDFALFLLTFPVPQPASGFAPNDWDANT